MADKPTDEALENLFVEETGFDPDDFPAAIFGFVRAALAKWGQPAGATKEVENLRKALVYAAFALHVTPQYMLAQGITLIDGDTVRVSRDGWTVEASVNPHRQPAPATAQPDSVQEDAALQLIADLVRHIDRETCTHEETHRGGAIWEICNSCGSMWADDKGGKPEFKWPDCVEKARAFLDAARKQGEKQ